MSLAGVPLDNRKVILEYCEFNKKNRLLFNIVFPLNPNMCIQDAIEEERWLRSVLGENVR